MKKNNYTPGLLSPELNAAVTEQVKTALKEDLGNGDLSTACAPDRPIKAEVTSRDNGVLAGVFWFNEVFRQIDSKVSIHWNLQDGEAIKTNQTLCTLRGNGISILAGERCALNFLQTLSATATITQQFVQRSGGLKIMDTRKTIPGLRAAQKYAVTCGGANNHRQGLFDGILIKENHIVLYGSIQSAVSNIRNARPDLPIEVEVENLQQIQEAIAAKAELILLDNFSLTDIKEAVDLIGSRAEIEVSGGVTLENIHQIAQMNIQRCALGAMTKNIQALDLSMRFQAPNK